ILDEAGAAPPCAIDSRERITATGASPDGQLVAFANEHADGASEVTLLDAAGCVARPLFVLPQSVWVHALAFAPDGRRLASGDERGNVAVFDLDTGQLRKLAGHKQAVYRISWSPDGARLASAGDDDTVRLWDPERGTAARLLRIPTRPLGIGFGPRGVLIVV